MSQEPAPLVCAERLSRCYHDASRELCVLRDVSFTLQAAQTLAVIGPSGSGKSTLLGLLAGLDRPSAGRVLLAGQDLAQLKPGDAAVLRGQTLGFIFQSYRLFSYASALENVSIPLEIQGESAVHLRAQELLEAVGLGHRLHHRPAQLSGGEQQRVAIARALVSRPRLILADEPTGNLDPQSGEQIAQLLFDLCRDFAVALVLVTHDQALAARCHRILRLAEGQVEEEHALKEASTISSRPGEGG